MRAVDVLLGPGAGPFARKAATCRDAAALFARLADQVDAHLAAGRRARDLDAWECEGDARVFRGHNFGDRGGPLLNLLDAAGPAGAAERRAVRHVYLADDEAEVPTPEEFARLRVALRQLARDLNARQLPLAGLRLWIGRPWRDGRLVLEQIPGANLTLTSHRRRNVRGRGAA